MLPKIYAHIYVGAGISQKLLIWSLNELCQKNTNLRCTSTVRESQNFLNCLVIWNSDGFISLRCPSQVWPKTWPVERGTIQYNTIRTIQYVQYNTIYNQIKMPPIYPQGWFFHTSLLKDEETSIRFSRFFAVLFIISTWYLDRNNAQTLQYD